MNSEELLQETLLKERKFLHDLSNQLVVSQGMGSFVVRFLDKQEDVDPKAKERMAKVYKSIGTIIEMVKERRAYLHEHSSDKK